MSMPQRRRRDLTGNRSSSVDRRNDFGSSLLLGSVRRGWLPSYLAARVQVIAIRKSTICGVVS